VDHLRAANRTGVEAKIRNSTKSPPPSPKRLPVKVILQHWRLPTRRPGPAAVRLWLNSAFVDERRSCDPRFLAFFFISGQRFCFHRLIFSSLRSSARPLGRWQLHPSCAESAGMAGRGSGPCTLFSIRWATRADVHRPLVAQSLRPSLQAAFDAPQVFWAQTRFASCPSGPLQRRTPPSSSCCAHDRGLSMSPDPTGQLPPWCTPDAIVRPPHGGAVPT